MENSLHVFLAELIEHFSEQEDVQYVCYDGSNTPNIVSHDPLFIMESKTSLEHSIQWLSKYLTNEKTLHYYELYRALIKETAGLWVNPTINELRTFNRNNHLNQDAHLENYQSLEEKRKKVAINNLADKLDKNGYAIFLGKDFIDRLINLYDLYNKKDRSFLEWVDPIDISIIDNHAYYIVDREVFMQPVKVSEHLLNEYENRKMSLLPSMLPLYFEHVFVTKRGIKSQDIVKEKQLDINFYEEITDYLEENEYENLDTAYQKLFKNNVEPSLPFVEIIADMYTELYMNTKNLKTEDDLLAFINHAYVVEGLDLEAKAFNRKTILRKLVIENLQEEPSTDYDGERYSSNKWDDKNYSFK